MIERSADRTYAVHLRGCTIVQNPGSRSVYPPDLYPPAWSGPVYPPSTLYPLAGSRSVTGYI